ncbi:MAG TPA: hypothetical protein VMW52_04070 [Phycisphaerae bacterium]|nr:hypothetical protein [Phycisphaerae bacterium]
MQEQAAPFLGVATRLSPASPNWRPGLAALQTNLRIGTDDLLRRRPGLSAYASTRPAAYSILNMWIAHFEDSDGSGTAADYLVVKCNAKLYWTALPLAVPPVWAEIVTAAAASLGLSATEPGRAFVYNDFFYYFDSTKAYGWNPGYNSGGAFWDQGEAFEPGLAPPTTPTCATADDTTSRILRGARNYVATHYDERRNVRSLPSTAHVFAEADLAADNAKKVQVTSVATGGEAATQESWRSQRTSVYDAEIGDMTHFQRVGPITGTPADDKRSDEELRRDGRLDCRGGRPLPCRYAIVWRGRAYYSGYAVNHGTTPTLHKDNTAGSSYTVPIPHVDGRSIEWSSAGRPEEVARKYLLSVSSTNVEQSPELEPGLFMEAKTWLPDDAGGIVRGMVGFGQEVLVFTEREASSLYGAVEPFGQRILAQDIGLCSHRTLQVCGGYGLMGADAEGPWVWTGQDFVHLGRAALDLGATSPTGVHQAALSASLAVWVRDLQEYWWIVSPPGSTAKTRVMAYQADRGVFSGPYDFNLGSAEITAAANVVLANTAPVTILGLSNGYIVQVDPSALTDSDGATARNFTCRARFWFGSDDVRTAKVKVRATVVYASITPDKEVTARLWAGDAVDLAEIESLAPYPHTAAMETYPVGFVGPEGRGRFAAADILIPEGCDAPIASVVVEAEAER